MSIDIDFIKTINKDKIEKCLNEIVIENDNEKRKDLILNLHTLDYIHTAHEHSLNKPFVGFYIFTFITYKTRTPTNEECIDFFINHKENILYKYQNATEYKNVLTKTSLRKLLFELYFEESLSERLVLLTNYLSNPRKITIKRKRTTKREYIDMLKANGIYGIEDYENLNKVPYEKLKKYCD